MVQIRADTAVEFSDGNPSDVEARRPALSVRTELNREEKNEKKVRKMASVRSMALMTALQKGLSLARTQRQFLLARNSGFVLSVIVYTKLGGRRQRYLVDMSSTVLLLTLSDMCRVLQQAFLLMLWENFAIMTIQLPVQHRR